jgi:hypothetical protein
VATLVCGCFAVSPPEKPGPGEPVEAVAVKQEGTVTTYGLSQTVYYPIAFLSMPSLEVTPADSRTVILRIEQKPDCFVVSATTTTAIGPQGGTIKWRARGPVPKVLGPSAAETSGSTFATTEGTKPDSAKLESAKPESAKAECTKPECTKAECAK